MLLLRLKWEGVLEKTSELEIIAEYRIKVNELYDASDLRITAKVPLTKDLFAIIDKVNEKEVNQLKWHANTQEDTIQARRHFRTGVKTLNRFILELTALRQGDVKDLRQSSFKNQFPLDCRLDNIVGAGRQVVMQNRRGKRGTTSTYKGVHKAKPSDENSRFKAQISVKEEGSIYLGLFDNECDAAEMYDAAASVLFKSPYRNLPDQPVNEATVQEAQAIIERFKHNKKLRLASKKKVVP